MPGHVEGGDGPGIDSHLPGDPLAVVLVEVHHDRDDLAQDVDVGRHGGHRPVEEEHVLHEEHQLLGHPGAVAEQGLGDVAELGDQLLGGEGGGVDGGPVEAEVADDRVDVDVGRAGRRGRAGPRSGRGCRWRSPPSRSRRKARRLRSSSRPVIPKSSRATRAVGLDEAGSRRAGRRGRRRRAGRPRGRRSARRGGPPRCRSRRRAWPSASPQAKPSRRSMTSTRRVTSCGMGSGHDDGALAGVGEDRGDVEHVLGLEPEVELLDDGLGEQLDQRGRVGEGGDRDAADQQRRDPAHGGEVPADQRGHVGPLDLDHHPLAGPQRAPRGPGRSRPRRWASGRTR